jgi:hypothetical protein
MLDGNLDNWIYYDGLAVLNSNGQLNFTTSLAYRYLKAMYWAVQTTTTVGFGDIVARSEAETWFCILFFFFTALLVSFTISNLTMAISNLDAAKVDNLQRISNFEKYATYRQLPNELTSRVISYYEHQYERFRGVAEHEVIKFFKYFVFMNL